MAGGRQHPMVQPLVEYPLEIGGVTTRALELEGDGPPLLLLHGFADSADTWRPALAILARRGRAALALDLPGFGEADPLTPGRPVLPQLDAFAAAAAGHLAAEHREAVLVGNSLGGVVSLRAGQDERLPLRAAVALAPAGLARPGWWRLVRTDPLRWLLAAPGPPVPAPLMHRVTGQIYRRLVLGRPNDVDPGVIRAFTQRHRSRAALARYVATASLLRQELDAPYDIERLRIPTLVIWGDRDRMFDHERSRALLEAVPGVTFELLAGSGHCPQVEVPRTVVEVIERFLMRSIQ
jgi:pimeloyl-ACP methyl ester carboxylesterase